MRRLLAILAACLFATSAVAQNSFPTPGGHTANGAVDMCLNGSGLAVACSASNPLPVNIAAGGATGVAQGSTTSGQLGSLMQGAATTSNPTYVNGTTDPLSLDLNGNLRVAGGLAQGSATSGQLGSMIMGAVTTGPPAYTTAQTSPASLDTAGNIRVALQGGTPISASATGTTAATTATLAGTAGKTTYICGFAIRANATAAATGNATVTGTVTGTLNFTQWTAPLASGIGTVEERMTPCLAASAANTGIAVVSAAPGSGGVVSVAAWGYQQ